MASYTNLATAEREFKQKQKQTEAAQAWRELKERNAQVLANTKRLRALRLARDEQASEPKAKHRKR